MMNKLMQSLKPAGMLLLLVFLYPACEKEEESSLDESLIIVKSSGDSYAIVSPATGDILQDVKPGILPDQFSCAHLGYRSEKVILLAKEPEGSYVKVIYTCDRETGDNITAITTKDQWDIQSLSPSLTSPKIVFHGHPADGGEDQSNLFTINLDGSGLQQLTQNREPVDGIELWWPGKPSWSPDGRQIAFLGTMRTPDPGGIWWGNAIIVMDADGDNKQILYNEPDSNSGNHYDISWTKDGKFLIFLTYEHYSNPSNRVKVLNTENGDMADITVGLLVDGKHTTNICTAPDTEKIIFNKYEPGGGDLHEINYQITEEGEFQLIGTPATKCRVSNGGRQFGSPHWQWFSAN